MSIAAITKKRKKGTILRYMSKQDTKTDFNLNIAV